MNCATFSTPWLGSWSARPTFFAQVTASAWRGYDRPRRSDTVVVLAYFNPVGYRRPEANLRRMCGELAACGVRTVVAQAYRDAPVTLPAGVECIAYQTDSVMFHKENLYNLAAKSLDEPKMLFLDCDLTFARADFFDAVSSALDRVDVVQPFSRAVWIGECGGIDRVKPGMMAYIAAGNQPWITRCHPGFAWGMTRRAFDRMGGFYENYVIGGGDTAFAYAVTQNPLRKYCSEAAGALQGSRSYGQYWARAAATPRLRVGHLAGLLWHHWHGSNQNRRYTSRMNYLPCIGDLPLVRRGDGLLEWEDPRHSAPVLEYLRSRREDG
jgi:hypothetical protein